MVFTLASAGSGKNNVIKVTPMKITERIKKFLIVFIINPPYR